MNRILLRSLPLVAAVFVLLLASCTPVRDRRTLNDMEALMPERPDSALAVLRSLQPRDLPGLHVRPLHALLLSEAFDKTYIDLTDDSLALAANKYYGEHGSKLHRLKSWYYLGRIRFNAGNYAEAVICYNKAVELAKAMANYHYIGLINREIANAYTDVWDDYHAIEYLRKSIESFDQAKEERYSAYSRLALARSLYKQKQFKDSRNELEALEESCSEQYIQACIHEMKAMIALQENSSEYDQILEDLYGAGVDKILQPTVGRYMYLAYVHDKKGNRDSADYYLNKAERISKTKGDSVVLTYNRFRINKNRGNLDSAVKDLEKSINSQDSTLYATLAQSLSYYQGSYYQNESRVITMRSRLRTMYLGLLILFLSLLSILLLFRSKKQRDKIMDEMARTSDIRQELLTAQGEKKNMARALAMLFENRMMILKTLSDQYEMLMDSHQKKLYEKGVYLSKDEVIASFRSKMLELRDDKNITLSMEETLNIWKEEIMRKFKSVFGADSPAKIRMTKEDFDLVPYLFSGMKQRTISYLTGYTEHSIKERKRRIRRKVESLDSSFDNEKKLFLENL